MVNGNVKERERERNGFEDLTRGKFMTIPTPKKVSFNYSLWDKRRENLRSISTATDMTGPLRCQASPSDVFDHRFAW